MSLTYSVPPVIGHRGAAGHAPENTLAGLRAAASLGATMVEFDVRLTRDGVPVLIHDGTLDRTTKGRGPVARRSLKALKALDAGAWFDRSFAGETIPTLEEALLECRRLRLGANIEIKASGSRTEATATATMAVAAAVALGTRPLVSSFSPIALRAARRASEDWPLGLLLGARPDGWRSLADELGVATLNVDGNRSTPAAIARFRTTGRPVLAYTINDPVRAQDLLDMGVAAIITDLPDRIVGLRSSTTTV